MANNINTFSMTAPTDYGADLKAIERRRKLAEMLQQQSMTPLETNQMAGGLVVPVSPLAGLGKMSQSLVAALGMRNADRQEKEVNEKARTSRASDFAAALRALEGTPASSETIMDEQANDGEGQTGTINSPAIPGSRRAMFASLLRSQDPSLNQMGMQGMLAKDEQETYGHDVKFTADGRAYVMGNRGNPRFLEGITPRDKMEVGNFGGTSQAYNPYQLTPGQQFSHTQTPDSQARIGQQRYEHANPSAYQNEQLNLGRGNLAVAQGNLGVSQGQLGVARGNLGINAQNSYFNTGMGPGMGGGGAMGGPQQPQPGQQPPQQPQQQPMPQQPGLTPKGAAAIAEKQGHEQAQNKTRADKALPLIAQARSILKGEAGPADAQGKPTRSPRPTGSYGGAAIDLVGRGVGMSSGGANRASDLEVIGSALMMQQPRLEGPQGVRDLELYEQMAARVADRTRTVAERLSALDQLEIIQKRSSGLAAPNARNVMDEADAILRGR